MALTNAERQAKFKAAAASKHDGQGERRLSAWITTAADCALDRLAAHHQTTRRDIIESLLLAEQDRIERTLSDTEHEQFIDRALPTNGPNH